jgi:hypothetical protein
VSHVLYLLNGWEDGAIPQEDRILPSWTIKILYFLLEIYLVEDVGHHFEYQGHFTYNCAPVFSYMILVTILKRSIARLQTAARRRHVQDVHNLDYAQLDLDMDSSILRTGHLNATVAITGKRNPNDPCDLRLALATIRTLGHIYVLIFPTGYYHSRFSALFILSPVSPRVGSRL